MSIKRRRRVTPQPNDIIRHLQQLGDVQVAEHAQRFFKTGRGEYGEGDRFLGIRVPTLRACVRQYRHIPTEDACAVLRSPWHEARLLALLILVARYSQGGDAERANVYRSYLANTPSINNWDLVDCSAGKIVGAHLSARSRVPLYRLARSSSLWERRIAIVATSHFIRQDDFTDTLAVAALLIDDREDLIHKAVGWMLREVGKRDRRAEERFLHAHYKQMPRTMLRYAIERFQDSARRAYLRGTR